jgi:hypothetical protein
MNILKELQKSIKGQHVMMILGAIVLVYILHQYSTRKTFVMDNMTGNQARPSTASSGSSEVRSAGNAQPASSDDQKAQFAQVSGMNTTTPGLAPVPSQSSLPDPSELLPKDQNNEWSRLNPVGGHDLQNVNLLKAGYHMGVDTVGSTLRNANLQLRSEPPNPTTRVSPWMNSTIEPDLMRTPLELGSRQ